jgi:hypothetical protein
MTATRPARLPVHRLGGVAAVALLLCSTAPPAGALTLDDRGEMRLGLRSYTAARVGTETIGGEDNPLAFPGSGTGHVRQHRYFLELKLDHDIRRLASTGYGLARLLGWLRPSTFKYSIQYRGEGEGIYDYGPDEFQHEYAKTKAYRQDLPSVDIPGLVRLSPEVPDEFVRQRVKHLRNVARQRHQLFLGYLDVEKGPVFVRVGRQVLAWGETDVFRLLDNINPLDQGFGGFLIPLDERRVPLDMLRGSYHFGSIGPLADTFLEAFGALGNRVATDPGIPFGSPWVPGGLGAPLPQIDAKVQVPDKTAFRGGARLVFTYRDVTYTLAHYYTYLDTPGIRFRIPGSPPSGGSATPSFNNPIIALQRVPRVPVTGASLTFPVPSFYTIVRSEAAYFQGEPFNRQGTGNAADDTGAPGSAQYRRLRSHGNDEGGLDPFLYPSFAQVTRTTPIQGRTLQRDSFNFSLGFDVNRYVRWLNPGQTFFISTQVFYKHVFDSPGDLVLPSRVYNRPVPATTPLLGTSGPFAFGCGPANARRPCRFRPRLIHVADDAILHTLLITTSYRGGRVVPSYAMFYDWQGALLFQPGVTLVRDPFRFVFDYTRINAGIGSGQIAALRDRDNVRFQVEFVF